ncbi:MAG: nucleotidyl transferase AbiEii/AbiGii toxin family protein [Planctomycetota bacterium]
MHELLARIVADLLSLKARHAVVGGHAVSARTEPRFTRDLDLAVAVANDREAEDLVASLGARGYRIVALIEQEASGRLATVRLEHASAHGVLVDLLFATAGVEPEVVDGASALQVLAKLVLPVASVGHLLALKTLSLDEQKRPQDRIDIAALLRVATAADLRAAEQAISLITQRGCNRGRDLLAMFAQLRAPSSS